jgi:hypothetical protein
MHATLAKTLLGDAKNRCVSGVLVPDERYLALFKAILRVFYFKGISTVFGFKGILTVFGFKGILTVFGFKGISATCGRK